MDNPAPVLAALLAAPIQAGGLSFAPFTLHHQLVLEKRQHRVILEENPELTLAEITELLYVLSQDPEAVAGALLSGPEEWDLALHRFSARVPPSQVPACLRAAIAQINTALNCAPPASKKKVMIP